MTLNRPPDPSHRRGGRRGPFGVVVTAVLMIVVAGCGTGLPSGLPSLPAVPSLPAIPSIPATPTAEPTAEPTIAPSAQPTQKPTAEPTAEPTIAPSAQPTQKPTAEPTAEPTEKPTAEPTAKPAGTATPTKAPSATPTPSPTPTPTPQPTPTPSPTPSPIPTPLPTFAPVQARFAASVVSGDAPLQVLFEDVSGGTITGRFWTFGDGDVSLLATARHTYKTDGLYTVTLTVWGPDGRDTRIKQNLIAVGSIAEFQAEHQDPAFTNQAAFWLTLAVSPPLAAFLAIRDHVDRQREAITSTTDQGHTLATLIATRNASTTPGAVDLAIESFLDAASRFRHRLDGTALENLDRSTSLLADLRRILLFETALNQVDPNDPRLSDLGQQVTDRLDEFNAAIDQLGASGQ